MPSIPRYDQRTTTPGGAVDGYQRATVVEDSVAPALAHLGDVAQDAGEEQLKLYNATAAREADTAYVKQVNGVLHGDGTAENPGFFGLRGQDALAAMPKVKEQLAQIRKDVEGGLRTPLQQRLFKAQADQRDLEWGQSTATHGEAQGLAWHQATSQNAVDQAQSDFARYYGTDPTLAEMARQTAQNESLHLLSLQGLEHDGVIVANTQRKVNSALYVSAAKSAVALDAGKAAKILADHKADIDPEDAAALQTSIDAKYAAQVFPDAAMGFVTGSDVTVSAPNLNPTPTGPGAGRGAPRGVRNNNPGNVKALGGGQVWAGQVGVDGDGYSVFGSPQAGETALQKNLQAKGRQGKNTVATIISAWAPKSDGNDTDAYIAKVAKGLGVKPDQPLNLADPRILGGLQKAITDVEVGPGKWTSGSRPLSVNGAAATDESGLVPLDTALANAKAWGVAQGMSPQNLNRLETETRTTWRQQHAAVQETVKTNFEAAVAIINGGGKFSDIPPDVLGHLPASRQHVLMTMAGNGGFSKSDDPTAVAYLHALMTDHPERFANEDMTKWAGKLSQGTYNSLMGDQDKARMGTGDFEDHRVTVEKVMGVSASLLKSVGVNPTAKGQSAVRVAQFQTQMLRAVAMWQKQNGGKVPDDEHIHRMADALLLSGKWDTGDTGIFGAKGRKAGRAFEAPLGRTFDFDVPPKARQQIIDAYTTRHGRRPTDRQVQADYLRFHAAGVY